MLRSLQDQLLLFRMLALAERSPSAMADALVAAGVVPPLVALLGKWEDFKAALPAANTTAPFYPWPSYVAALASLLAALAARGPATRRRLRDAGAAPLLRALAAETSSPYAPQCAAALRALGQ